MKSETRMPYSMFMRVQFNLVDVEVVVGMYIYVTLMK